MSGVVLFPQVVTRVVLPNTRSIGGVFANLFKTNKGVRIGTGLAATGGGFAILGLGAGSAKEAVGEIPFILILGIILVIFLMVMKR